jgi:hypothetical protein
MFKSKQYRAKAVEYGELIKGSTDAEEIHKFQELQDRLASLADNEQALADGYDNALQVEEQHRSHGLALAAEEELVLRCLGAAIIMQWNALPTTLQREIFDTAGSVGKLLETAALRGQIARFCTSTRMMPVAANCHQRKTRLAMRDRVLWFYHGGTTMEAQSAAGYRCESNRHQEESHVTYTISSR